ncbi:MAG: TolC family protein [Flavipsychrobacter sp.]
MRFLNLFIVLLFCAASSSAQVIVNGLDELLQYADKNSPQARQIQLMPQLAKEEKRVSVSTVYPKVNAFATGDYYPIIATQLIPAEALGGAPGTYLKAQFGLPYTFTAGAELTVPIIDLSNWANLSRAKAAYQEKKYSSETALENLHLQLIQSYYQTLVTGEVLELNKENEETAVELLRIMSERNEQGVVDPADYNRTKNLLLDVKSTRISYTSRMAQALNALNATLGTDTIVLKEELNDFEWPVLYEGGDITNRPAWQEVSWKVRAAELAFKQKQMAVLPKLSLASRYAYNMQTNFEPNFTNIEFDVANVGLRLNMPLFQGNFHRSSKKISKLQWESARLEKDRVKATLTQQQEDWMAQYQAAYAKQNVLKNKLETAAENLRIAKLNVKEDVMEFDEFNNIFIEYNKARMEYVQNLADGILYHLLSTQNF